MMMTTTTTTTAATTTTALTVDCGAREAAVGGEPGPARPEKINKVWEEGVWWVRKKADKKRVSKRELERESLGEEKKERGVRGWKWGERGRERGYVWPKTKTKKQNSSVDSSTWNQENVEHEAIGNDRPTADQSDRKQKDSRHIWPEFPIPGKPETPIEIKVSFCCNYDVFTLFPLSLLPPLSCAAEVRGKAITMWKFGLGRAGCPWAASLVGQMASTRTTNSWTRLPRLFCVPNFFVLVLVTIIWQRCSNNYCRSNGPESLLEASCPARNRKSVSSSNLPNEVLFYGD